MRRRTRCNFNHKENDLKLESTAFNGLLTEKQVAQILNVAPGSLRRWRTLPGVGPAFRKLGPSLVRYHADDVSAFVESARKN